MRDKIADIVRDTMNETYGDSDKVADAIIAALPDMVDPLEWKLTKHTHPVQLGARARGAGIYYSVISTTDGGQCVLSSHGGESIGPFYFVSIDKAKAAANAHHRAQILSAFGLHTNRKGE